MKDNTKRKNRTVIVVGASGGIGKKVAELLSKKYFVIGTYSRHPKELGGALPKSRFKGVHLDLQDASTIKNLCKKIKGEVYAIINCSGIVYFETGNLEKDLDIWHKTIAINLSGNYYLAKIFRDKLEENGRFIMISSTDSFYGGSITAAYAASKSGVNSLTKSLSLVLADKKIRVNSIAPGWVLTPMTQSNGDQFLAEVAAINPLKRNAEPQDVANLVGFLMSPQSDYINGQVIPLEGGYTNQDPT